MALKLIFFSFVMVFVANYCKDQILSYLRFLWEDDVNFNRNVNKERIQHFTLKQIQMYNGIDDPKLYLVIMGRVYDVTEKGRDHYGPNKPYHIFIGRDATRSFITGKMAPEDASDEVGDFEYQDWLSLSQWLHFYSKEYTFVGKLVGGRFYDELGRLTSYGLKAYDMLEKAEKTKENEKSPFPGCNIEWNEEKGTRVWCSKASGGVERDWIGVPRKFYNTGAKNYQCVCVEVDSVSLPNLSEYENCEKTSYECFYR